MNYPKRGEDCEYTMDCMWGVDGWCDRPKDTQCKMHEEFEKYYEARKKQDRFERAWVEMGGMQ